MSETLISWIALVVSVAALVISSLRWHVARQVARDAKKARRHDRAAGQARLRRDLFGNVHDRSFEPYKFIRREGHHSRHVAEEDVEALLEHAETVRTVWLVPPDGNDPRWVQYVEKNQLARRELRRILLGDDV